MAPRRLVEPFDSWRAWWPPVVGLVALVAWAKGDDNCVSFNMFVERGDCRLQSGKARGKSRRIEKNNDAWHARTIIPTQQSLSHLY